MPNVTQYRCSYGRKGWVKITEAKHFSRGHLLLLLTKKDYIHFFHNCLTEIYPTEHSFYFGACRTKQAVDKELIVWRYLDQTLILRIQEETIVAINQGCSNHVLWPTYPY